MRFERHIRMVTATIEHAGWPVSECGENVCHLAEARARSCKALIMPLKHDFGLQPPDSAFSAP